MIRDREKIVNILAEVKPKVRERVSSAVLAILTLAEAFRSQGEAFTFENSDTLYAGTMEVLRKLSEGCYEDAEKLARLILEDADFSFEDYEESQQDKKEHGLLWAFDMHASNLLKIIAAWLAIGFSKGLTTAEIHSHIMTSLNAPESSPMWRDAVRERLIDPDEVRFGRGYQRRIVDSITILIQSILWQVLIGQQFEEAEEDGALYYVVHRGSTFDCPVCDSNCERLTPMSKPYVVPHPRCMCWIEFIFSEAEAMQYR